jgi:hypothetical protein
MADCPDYNHWHCAHCEYIGETKHAVPFRFTQNLMTGKPEVVMDWTECYEHIRDEHPDVWAEDYELRAEYEATR